ncbi:MAG TPA: ATP-binding protein [Actinomycetota bacterium]|nr:ATP-binding protein [Actinomycetota bacterium]
MNDESTGRLLLALTRDVTGTLDLQQVLDRSLAALRRLVPFGGGAIQLIHNGALVAAATDPPMAPQARTVRIPVGSGVSGRIAARGEPVYIPDITIDARVHPEGRAKGVSGGVRSYFGLPLIAHGEIIGVVQVDAPRVDAFSQRARETITAFVPAIAAAVQNATIHAHEIATVEERIETERLKHDFIAIVSHELRTPLTTVVGFAESLERLSRELDPEMVSYLAGRILAGGRRLGRHLDDLMRVAGLLDGDLAVAIATVDVAPVVRAACAESTDPHHPLRLRIEPSLPQVATDPDRLHQIVGALVSNACKFSPPGAEVTVRAGKDPDGSVRVSVQDRGRGISAEHIEQVFDRFFQVSPADRRETGGMGIGLYLARLLCDRMNARIDVRSAVGEGSTFTVALPILVAPRDPTSAAAAGAS